MRLRPGTLHPGASPPFRAAIHSRGGGRILARKEDLRPSGRWIRPPTEVVNSICNLTQFNAIFAILRKCQQFHANSRKPMQIPASSSKTEELPSPMRNPFCELDLHRRICSFFVVPHEPQAGLGGCRQGIDAKRRVHRRELAEKAGVLRKLIGNMNRRRGSSAQSTALIVTLPHGPPKL